MARENGNGRASERAARLRRRLQAAEAMANGGDGWTTAVDAYATPTRAAAPGAPRVEAGEVVEPAATQAANVPNYQQPNEDLMHPHGDEAEADDVPQTHNQQPNEDLMHPHGDEAQAEDVPQTHGTLVQHGIYDGIPLPQGAPRWATADEQVLVAAGAGGVDSNQRSVPVTMFSSFHHDATMAKIYPRAAPIIGAALTQAARMRGTVRYEPDASDGGRAAWADAWPNADFDAAAVIILTPLEFVALCGTVSDRVDANWQLMANVWPAAAEKAHRAVPAKAARVAAVFGLDAGAMMRVASFAEQHELPAPTLHMDAGIDAGWFGDDEDCVWVRQSILHQHMPEACRSKRGVILISGLGKGKSKVPLFLARVAVQPAIDLAADDADPAGGASGVDEAAGDIAAAQVTQPQGAPTAEKLVREAEARVAKITEERDAFVTVVDNLRKQLRKCQDANETLNEEIATLNEKGEQAVRHRDEVHTLREQLRKSEGANETLNAKVAALNEKGAQAVRQRDEAQAKLDKMALSYYSIKTKYAALADEVSSTSSRAAAIDSDAPATLKRANVGEQDPFTTTKPARRSTHLRWPLPRSPIGQGWPRSAQERWASRSGSRRRARRSTLQMSMPSSPTSRKQQTKSCRAWVPPRC